MAEETKLNVQDEGEVRRTAEKSLEDITKIHNDLLEILKEFDTPEKRDFFPPAAVKAITRAADAVGSSVYTAKQVIRLQNHVLCLLLDPIEGSLKSYSETLQKEIEEGRSLTREAVETLTSFTRERTDETMRSVSEMSARTSDETVNSMTAIEEMSARTINQQKESIDTIKELTAQSAQANSEAQIQLREMMKQAKIQGKESLAEIKRLAREAKSDLGKTRWATAAIVVLCLTGGWYASTVYSGGNMQATNRHKSTIQQMEKKPELVKYTKKEKRKKNKIRQENLKVRKITKTSGK